MWDTLCARRFGRVARQYRDRDREGILCSRVQQQRSSLDSRTLGLLTRLDGPGSVAPKKVGTDAGVAPLFGIGDSNSYRPLTGAGLGSDDATGVYHHGLITFAGGENNRDSASFEIYRARGPARPRMKRCR